MGFFAIYAIDLEATDTVLLQLVYLREISYYFCHM